MIEFAAAAGLFAADQLSCSVLNFFVGTSDHILLLLSVANL